jgi:molecular chaperone GrpE
MSETSPPQDDRQPAQPAPEADASAGEHARSGSGATGNGGPGNGGAAAEGTGPGGPADRPRPVGTADSAGTGRPDPGHGGNGGNGGHGGNGDSGDGNGSPAMSGHEEGVLPSIEAQLADAEARSAEYMELYLRARAELDNFRRRAQADVSAAHKYAIEGFAESLLPVKDSLEMSLKVDAPTVENLREGVAATLRLMTAAFEKHKLLEIDPAGEKFDPNRHQAISMIPASDVPANHVVSVLQKGYLINDRVLRPALVTVRGGS